MEALVAEFSSVFRHTKAPAMLQHTPAMSSASSAREPGSPASDSIAPSSMLSAPLPRPGSLAWMHALLDAWQQRWSGAGSPALVTTELAAIGIRAGELPIHGRAGQRMMVAAHLGPGSDTTKGWAVIDPLHLHVFTSPDGRMAHPNELRQHPDWVAAERCERRDGLRAGADEWTYWSSGPRSINFQIGDICNMHCVMCWQELRRSSHTRSEWHPEMPASMVEGVLSDHLATVDALELVSFGEPMANPQFDEIVRTVEALGHRRGWPFGLNVITNGSLLGLRQHMAVLRQPGYLTFSIDSADSAVYESIRLGGRWADVVGNLRDALAYPDRHVDRKIGINMTVFTKNIDGVFAMGAFAAGLGLDYLSILHGAGLSWPSASGLEIDKRDPRLQGQITRIRASFPWLTLNDYATDRTLPALPAEVRPDRAFCPLPWRQYDVGPDGKAHPCCRSYSIDLGKPSEAWTGKPMQELRRQILAGDVDPERFGACARCPNVGPQRQDSEGARVIALKRV